MPLDQKMSDLWRRAGAGHLETPDTWEVALSGGADKRATWERLLAEGKLGYLALLRNLRNMQQAGVSEDAVTKAILARRGGADRVLPFRYVAAARAAPAYEPALDKALQAAIKDLPQLKGRTTVLVDVSGSMDAKLSEKSDLTRMDAAAALASIIPAEELRVFSFSDKVVEVPPRRGMAGVDAVVKSQRHSGTYLGAAVRFVSENVRTDRLIVISDEQSSDAVVRPDVEMAIMINVASNKNGVGYESSGWNLHIDGFSENIFRFIEAFEAED